MSKTSMNSKMIVGVMAILFVSVGPLISVNASPPTEATEFYYGVEYDWNSVNPDIENLLTIMGTNINAGNVEFDATVNPDEDIQIIIGKDYQDFLNLNR